jgi:hypothetical protein
VFHQANGVVAPLGSGGVLDLGEDPEPADGAGFSVANTAFELIDDDCALNAVLAVSISRIPLIGAIQGLARRTSPANRANAMTAVFRMRIPP